MKPGNVGKIIAGFTATVSSFLVTASVAFAADDRSITGNLGEVVKGTDLARKSDLPLYIAGIIQTILSILGVIFLLLVIYAGFQWMTSRGETGKVASAKNLLREAVIGLIIILAANVIAYFVVDQLKRNITGI